MSGAANPSGELRITLRRDGTGGVRSARLASTRPVLASKLFHGMAVEEALNLLPRLYSVCGNAQACAAVRAVERARGDEVAPEREGVRDALVALESAKEHLWRIALDWPRRIDAAPDRELATEAMGLVGWFRTVAGTRGEPFLPGGVAPIDALSDSVERLESLLERRVYSMPPSAWLAMEAAEWFPWVWRGESVAARMVQKVVEAGWSDFGDVAVSALPNLDPERLDQLLGGEQADAFVAQPSWEGEVRESSSFTRRRKHPLVTALVAGHGSGLLPRLAARLVDLALIPGQMRAALSGEMPPVSAHGDDGRGLAQVEAARGRLVHRVVLSGGVSDDGVIDDYRILAPTEWNFHPRGVLVRALESLLADGADSLERHARLLVEAIDPCVEAHLEVQGGAGEDA